MILVGLKFPQRFDNETRTPANKLQKKFEVLTAASMKMTVFWVAELCSQTFTNVSEKLAPSSGG
jgi:hypothetical protein